MHMSTQLVVRHIMWAGVENKNEHFLGFSSVVCGTVGKKGKFGELGDQELINCNSLNRVSRGFKGKTGLEWWGNSTG